MYGVHAGQWGACVPGSWEEGAAAALAAYPGWRSRGRPWISEDSEQLLRPTGVPGKSAFAFLHAAAALTAVASFDHQSTIGTMLVLAAPWYYSDSSAGRTARHQAASVGTGVSNFGRELHTRPASAYTYL